MAVTESALPDTPVMRQYQELKRQHPQSLLFFRLGDFFELFGDDARNASQILGLVLTQRQGVPMCGVPAHNVHNYLSRLLRAGQKIAIADQLEAPSKDKKIVPRGVVRIVTPGTLVEDELLDPTSSNYLVALKVDLVGWGAACLDISTGESWATQVLHDPHWRKLSDLIARVRPSEILAEEEAAAQLRQNQILPSHICLSVKPSIELNENPKWAQDSVWKSNTLAVQAAILARRYIDEAKLYLQQLPEPTFKLSESVMLLDDTAIRTLEIIEASSGEKKHTLWGFLDLCQTPMGSRKLKSWLLHPSTDVREIQHRQNCVEDLFDRTQTRATLKLIFEQISDLPRVMSRLSTRQAGPRDLGALNRSLAQLPALEKWAEESAFNSGIRDLSHELKTVSAKANGLRLYLEKAIVDEPPARLSDGNFVRPGFNEELDSYRRLKNDSDQVLRELEEREKTATGINTLKAGYNSVFGYYLEISKAQAIKAPAHYIRKQTLTNAERYITPELKELETKILSAEEKMLRLESTLFNEIRAKVLEYQACLFGLAEIISQLDVFQALAETACRHDLIKPRVDDSFDLEIVDGKHPVLASLLPSGSFVPNSLNLNANDPQILILTGPNMAGKSTYLRQNALIAILAQIGSFVPAKSARIGIIDKILTRIGAQDALAQGDSTFMVEMKETSHILRSATTRSLVVLDEVGRGTSTFDGISIAWAVLEHLHSAYEIQEKKARGPRTLFATHYFELTELAKSLPGIINANVEVKEWRNALGDVEVVFLHKIGFGPADRSYGIHVAALAGLPASLIARAGAILESLEKESPHKTAQTVMPSTPSISAENPFVRALELISPETMTPLEALQFLIALKKEKNVSH